MGLEKLKCDKMSVVQNQEATVELGYPLVRLLHFSRT